MWWALVLGSRFLSSLPRPRPSPPPPSPPDPLELQRGRFRSPNELPPFGSGVFSRAVFQVPRTIQPIPLCLPRIWRECKSCNGHGRSNKLSPAQILGVRTLEARAKAQHIGEHGQVDVEVEGITASQAHSNDQSRPPGPCAGQGKEPDSVEQTVSFAKVLLLQMYVLSFIAEC